MSLLNKTAYFATHPYYLALLIQWKLFGPATTLHADADVDSARLCFQYLDQTSRSFALLIRHLPPELVLPVCIFYLVLRGLDTIEDDTSIPHAAKTPLLRNFSTFLDRDGWNYAGNRAGEKDRALLLHFDVVIAEYKKLSPPVQGMIKNVASEMGNGMADMLDTGINTVDEYNRYCWFVAGVVGKGLTEMFTTSGLASEMLKDEYTAMGLLLQKVNLIRDVHEDHGDGRAFWPREIWGKHVAQFEDLFGVDKRQAATGCSSEMVLDALGHVRLCLAYMAKVDGRVLRFCAVAQGMGMATLEKCFRNEAVFTGKVKIGWGEALEVLVRGGDMEGIRGVYRTYVRRIRGRNRAGDPSFERIRDVCDEIEACIDELEEKDSEKGKEERVVRGWGIGVGVLAVGVAVMRWAMG